MKHRPQTIFIIAAVAVMLAGATSAYGYYEAWDGWFKDGYLNYSSKTYDLLEANNVVNDSTSNLEPVDLFYRMNIPAIAFVCAAGWNDSIFVYISSFTGEKENGQSGTHDGSGFWAGEGYSNRDMKQEHLLFTFGGSWEAEFDYGPETYEGTWMVTWSGYPVAVSGSGTSSGELQ